MNLDLELLERQEAAGPRSAAAPTAQAVSGEAQDVEGTLGVLLAMHSSEAPEEQPEGCQTGGKAETLFVDAMNAVLKKTASLASEKGDPLQILPRCCFYAAFLSELLQGYFREDCAGFIFRELFKCFAGEPRGLYSILQRCQAVSQSGAPLQDLRFEADLAIWAAGSFLREALKPGVLLRLGTRDFLSAVLADSPQAIGQLASRADQFGPRVMKTTPASAVEMMEELRSVFETEVFLGRYEELRRAARPGGTAHAEFVLDAQRAVIPRYGFPGDSGGVRDMREELVRHHLQGANTEVGRLRRDLDMLLGLGEKCVSVEDERRRVHEEVAIDQGRSGRLPCRCEEWLSFDGRTADGEPVEGVCLVTQCSLDRLGRLEELLAVWPGELSAAVYVDGAPGSEAAEAARKVVAEACARAGLGRSCEGGRPPRRSVVAVHRLEDSEVRCPAYDLLFPVNALRNAALERASARLVLLADVDFVPSAALYSVLCGDDNGRSLRRALRDGACACRAPLALVVPAFEETERLRGPLPRDGAALRAAHAAGGAEGFHLGSFPRGHRATDFRRWLAGPGDRPRPAGLRLRRSQHGVDGYAIEYEEQFEPYIVADRAVVPPYDERFRGYGLNKASHLYELNARGFSFCTLDHPDAFLVARRHAPSASRLQYLGPEKDKKHRARLAAHFAAFKWDLKVQLAGQQLPRCRCRLGPA